MNSDGFSAGEFGVQEVRLNPVEQVQAPVVDTSSVVEGAALLQGINSAANLGSGVYKEVKSQQAAKEIGAATKDFEKKLLTARTLADQFGSESIRFKTYLTGAFQGSNLDFGDKTKMMKDFESTILGKSFTTLTPEEKGFKKQREEAVAAGYVMPWMTEEEATNGQASYQNKLTQSLAHQEKIEQWQRDNFDAEMTPEQLAVYDRKLGEQRYTALSSMVSLEREPAKNFIKGIEKQLEEGSISNEEAQAILKAKRGDMNALIGQISRGMRREDVEALAKPYLDLFDASLIVTDSATTLKNLKDQTDIMVATTSRNLLVDNPDMVKYISASSFFNSPVVDAEMAPMVVKMVRQNEDAKNPFDVVTANKDTDSYFELLADNISKVGDVDVKGNLVVKPEELLVQADSVIRSGNKFIDEDSSPKSIQKYVEFLARPDVGGYLGENYGKLSSEARVKLEDTLIKNAKNYVYPAVQSIISSEFKVEGKRSGVDENEVEMRNSNGRILFASKTSDPWTKSVVQKMNREVGGALNTYFNAIGNLSGEDFNTTYERERSSIWPSKYPVEETQQEQAVPTPEVAPKADPLEYSGKVVEDANGDRWASRGGTWVKIGSRDDGSK